MDSQRETPVGQIQNDLAQFLDIKLLTEDPDGALDSVSIRIVEYEYGDWIGKQSISIPIERLSQVITVLQKGYRLYSSTQSKLA